MVSIKKPKRSKKRIGQLLLACFLFATTTQISDLYTNDVSHQIYNEYKKDPIKDHFYSQLELTSKAYKWSRQEVLSWKKAFESGELDTNDLIACALNNWRNTDTCITGSPCEDTKIRKAAGLDNDKRLLFGLAAIPLIGAPAVGWDGTAGTGWSGATSATTVGAGGQTSICQPIVVPWQITTTTDYIGVHAFHINGIRTVKCAAEGGTFVDNYEWSYNPNYQGGQWAYWFQINASTFNAHDGGIEIRFDAHPLTNGVSKVISGSSAGWGPPLGGTVNTWFVNAGGTLTSGDLTIYVKGTTGNDGSNGLTLGTAVKTIQQALYLIDDGPNKTGTVIIAEAGTYPATTLVVGGITHTRFTTITIDSGLNTGDVIVAPPSRDVLRPRFTYLRWKNIKFDLSYISQIYVEDSWTDAAWFDNCQFYASSGRYGLYSGSAPLTHWLRPDIPNSHYFTGCTCTDTFSGIAYAQLIINCTTNRIAQDMSNNTSVLIGHIMSDDDYGAIGTQRSAFTIIYAGAGTTATIEKSGENSDSNGHIILKVDGSTVLDFTTADGTRISDLATSVNALSGWTMEVLDNTLGTKYISTNNNTGSFTAQNCKNNQQTLITVVDIHSDCSQFFGTISNTIHLNCRYIHSSTTAAVQMLFHDHTSSSFTNMAVINYLGDHHTFRDATATQYASAHTHVLTWHCSILNQTFFIRDDFAGGDQFVATACEIKHCILDLLSANGAFPVAGLTIDNNHFIGSLPSGTTSNSTTGGTLSSLFVDYIGGDFRPVAGTTNLVTQSGTPLVATDRLGLARCNDYWCKGPVENLSILIGNSASGVSWASGNRATIFDALNSTYLVPALAITSGLNVYSCYNHGYTVGSNTNISLILNAKATFTSGIYVSGIQLLNSGIAVGTADSTLYGPLSTGSFTSVTGRPNQWGLTSTFINGMISSGNLGVAVTFSNRLNQSGSIAVNGIGLLLSEIMGTGGIQNTILSLGGNIYLHRTNVLKSYLRSMRV